MSNELNVSNFAKEIHLKDLLSEANSPDDRNRNHVYASIFEEIAGADGVIQESELKAFLEQLKEAAGEDGVLSEKEMTDFYVKFCQKGKGLLESISSNFHVDFARSFINKLIKVNNEKASTQDNSLPTDRYFKNNRLEKEVIKNKDGGTTTNLYDNRGNLSRVTILDSEGNFIKDESYDRKGNVIEHKYSKDADGNYSHNQDITRDANGNIIKIKDICEDSSTEKFYDNGKVIMVRDRNKDGYTDNFCDGNGKVTKEVCYKKKQEKYEKSSVKEYLRDKEGEVISSKETLYRPSEIVTNKYDGYFGRKIEEVVRDLEGNIKCSEKYLYKEGKDGCTIEITEHYDAEGNIEHTIRSTDNGYIEEYKDKTSCIYEHFDYGTLCTRKDASGNVVETIKKETYADVEIETITDSNGIRVKIRDSGYNLLESIDKDVDGNVISRTTYERTEGKKLETKYDSEGKLVSRTTEEYDSKGRIKFSHVEDSNGNVLPKTLFKRDDENNITTRTTFDYHKNGELKRYRQEEIDYNNRKITTISDEEYDDNGQILESYDSTKIKKK